MRIPDTSTSLPKQGDLARSLHKTFDISQSRPGQNEVIQSVLHRQDTLAVMPAGSGESLCYQIAALNLPGTTVVVSPLIALMKDQAEKQTDALQDGRQARSAIVFATPERLADPAFVAALQRTPVNLFVVDEAHCISQWAHDFRPAYLELGNAINALGRPPVLALTATATQQIVDDIQRQLGMTSMHVVNSGIYRKNLHYRVVHATSNEEKLQKLLAIVSESEGSGIIYTATVKAAEQLALALHQAGVGVTLYHGQLAKNVRSENQENFMQGKSRVMVATNAFGMVIDKPDIRFVIHFQLPANLETYYQESGRAGRDGQPAVCTLLYYVQDKRIQQFFLARHYPAYEEIHAVYQALQNLAAVRTAVRLDQLDVELDQFSVRKLQVTLKLLQDGGVIARDEQSNYRVLKPIANAAKLAALGKTYSEKAEPDRQGLERMVFYAQSGFCRWKILLSYFGEETEWEHCGNCDNCLHAPEQSLSPLSARAQSARKIVAKTPLPPAFAPGALVQVPKIGEGQVISVAGDKVTILFPDKQKRTFLRDYVKRI